MNEKILGKICAENGFYYYPARHAADAIDYYRSSTIHRSYIKVFSRKQNYFFIEKGGPTLGYYVYGPFRRGISEERFKTILARIKIGAMREISR